MTPEDAHCRLGIHSARQSQDELLVLLRLPPLREAGLDGSKECRRRHLLLLRWDSWWQLLVAGILKVHCARGCHGGTSLPGRLRLLGDSDVRTLVVLHLFCLKLLLDLHAELEALGPRSRHSRAGCRLGLRLPHASTGHLLGSRSRCCLLCSLPRCGLGSNGLGRSGGSLLALGKQARMGGSRGQSRLLEFHGLLTEVGQLCQLIERPAVLWLIRPPMQLVVIAAGAIGFLPEGVPLPLELAVDTPALAIGRRVAQEVAPLLQQLLELIEDGARGKLSRVLRGADTAPALLLGRPDSLADCRPGV
mmetsp:Transcript_42410/g.95726  ORF Transcript_42410/g.95726 Transcript_42410/m.95726 type:complete len:305 (+) Transcript_42410:1405-2319(+)